MKRRNFMAVLTLAAAMGSVQAQQTGKVYHIAVVDPSTPPAEMSETGGNPRYRALFEKLRQLGYIVGQDLLIERFSGEGAAEHYPELTRSIVRRNPDLILAVGYRLVLDFKAATAAIPIVGIMADPVANGIVPSLARPGGNITGVSVDAGSEIFGKRLELLREAIPLVSRVGFLVSRELWEGPRGAAMREAAENVGISLITPPLDAPFQGTTISSGGVHLKQQLLRVIIYAQRGWVGGVYESGIVVADAGQT